MTVVLVFVALALAVLLVALVANRRSIVAVREDPDFGRISLFGDGRWAGVVELEDFGGRVDLEIERDGDVPSLRQRLVYQDVLHQLPSLLPSIAERAVEEGDVTDAGQLLSDAHFLTLRLAADEGRDWSLSFVLDDDAVEGYEVAVRDGEIVDFYFGR